MTGNNEIRVLLNTLVTMGYDLSDGRISARLSYGETEAAKMLSISPRTLFTLRSEGKIKAKRIGTRVVYARSELERFLASDN